MKRIVLSLALLGSSILGVMSNGWGMDQSSIVPQSQAKHPLVQIAEHFGEIFPSDGKKKFLRQALLH